MTTEEKDKTNKGVQKYAHVKTAYKLYAFKDFSNPFLVNAWGTLTPHIIYTIWNIIFKQYPREAQNIKPMTQYFLIPHPVFRHLYRRHLPCGVYHHRHHREPFQESEQ